ncbi:MAG: hypothetical protein N3J91_00385 [Verrucomicrobiae bacterium]|nr:hypothetical protein [Verrucomicrobiae bacterium]
MPAWKFTEVFSAWALTLFFLAVACNRSSTSSPQPSPNTMSENPQRERVGLRTVKATWHLYRVQFGAEDWKVASNDYLAKRIQRDSQGKPQWEEDYYYSGSTYRTENGGQDWERITVHYDYGPGTLEVHYIGTNSTIHAAFDGLKSKASTTAEKLSVVDETLKAWGLSRVE